MIMLHLNLYELLRNSCRQLAVLIFALAGFFCAVSADAEPASDRKWDRVQDRYESLCNECLAMKRKAEAGEKVSTKSLTRVLSDLEELRNVLKDAGGSMSPEQLSLFDNIRRRYSPEPAAAEHTVEPAAPAGTSDAAAPRAAPPSSVQKNTKPVPAPLSPEEELSAPSRPEFPLLAQVLMIKDVTAMIGTPCDPDVRVSSLPSFSLEPAPRQLRFSVGGVVAVVPDISYGLVLNLDFLRSRWGLYARYRSNFRPLNCAYDCLSDGTADGESLWFSGEESTYKMQFSLGLRRKLLPFLGVSAGLGHGNYVTAWEDLSGRWARVEDYSAAGFLFELGLFVPLGKALELSAGFSTTAFRYSDLELGLAVCF